MKTRIIAALLLPVLLALPDAASARPTVIELFTSQGCSACPPAETLLRQLSQDPALLALSFHVHYFDQLGWKDPYGSEASTERQKSYVSALGLESVYTPQLVIDGQLSVAGNDDRAVEAGITAAENYSIEIPVSITPMTDGNLRIAIGGAGPKAQVSAGMVAWEMHFMRGGFTSISEGDNIGQMLESTNPVMRYVQMPLVPGRENDFMLSSAFPEDGVAVILQKQPIGQIMGAAVYLKPSAAGVLPSGQQAALR